MAGAKVAARVLEVVLQQARVDIVSVLTVVKKQTTNWEPLVMSRNAPNVERP